MDPNRIQQEIEEFTTKNQEFPFHTVKNLNIINYKGENVLLSSLYDIPNTNTSSSSIPPQSKTILMFGRNLL